MKDIYMDTAWELLDFIERSPSCYHVVKNIADIYDRDGCIRLKESEEWKLEAGKRYYVTRGGSSIIAFAMPERDMPDFFNYQMIAAHSDSPSFKIKENPELLKEGAYVSLNVEKYGGMIMGSWLDRPLSAAGRVVVSDGEGVKVRLVNIDRDLCVIPSLAIHMNRDINEGYSFNPQTDMIPLFGGEGDAGEYKNILAQAAGLTDAAHILASDMFLYNRTAPCIWGAGNEYISASKLDDLACVYTAVTAFSESSNDAGVTMCCIFDNEEVGSATYKGADSTFLSDVCERIAYASGKSNEGYHCALAASFMLSADNAHAVHPNYADKADPTNRPVLNKGIVIKFNANQKYTTDALSYAVFKNICEKAQVPYQTFANRSDMAGGSTLGNISGTHISVSTVDIGIPQLAMHSSYETAGVRDVKYMQDVMREYYNTGVRVDMCM